MSCLALNSVTASASQRSASGERSPPSRFCRFSRFWTVFVLLVALILVGFLAFLIFFTPVRESGNRAAILGTKPKHGPHILASMRRAATLSALFLVPPPLDFAAATAPGHGRGIAAIPFLADPESNHCHRRQQQSRHGDANRSSSFRRGGNRALQRQLQHHHHAHNSAPAGAHETNGNPPNWSGDPV